MKIKQLGKGTKTSVAVVALGADIMNKLHGKTINQALAAMPELEVGNDAGEFIKRHATVDGLVYALFGNNYVQLTQGAADSIDENTTMDDLGELTFWSGMSQVKMKDGQRDEENGTLVPVFRLTRPAGINLGETVKSLDATQVTA